jgi:hypothetical protein
MLTIRTGCVISKAVIATTVFTLGMQMVKKASFSSFFDLKKKEDPSAPQGHQ